MSAKTIEILCTLGPASLNERVIKRLDEIGVGLFRLNLSHTNVEDIEPTLQLIRKFSDVPICLDTEGAQIRTGSFAELSFDLSANSIIRAPLEPVTGNAQAFNFYPPNIVSEFKQSDFISIDFNSVLVQVIEADAGGVTMRVISGGKVGRNKAVTVAREVKMPPLTNKDMEAIQIGKQQGIKHFALSFANNPSDVNFIRNLIGPEAFLISKIESLSGVKNLEQIADLSNAILIDRGDLSRQAPIERIPWLQKTIIRRTKARDRKVYVATNLLESMIVAQEPTRAETNDIYNTLADGADGLVLAAETAIGKHPIQCANMIVRMIESFDHPGNEDQFSYQYESKSRVTVPVGGTLINRFLDPSETQDTSDIPIIQVQETDLMDCEQIALGTFSPLQGFMGREALSSVLEQNRLPDGTPWTMPIILQVSEEETKRFSKGDVIGLAGGDGTIRATMDVSEVFPIDFDNTVRAWFGTTSLEHPGVNRVASAGSHIVAGSISMYERLPSQFRQYELTPSQVRFIFSHRGWSKIVGFHTRNVVHQAHHHIQLEALTRCNGDGLFISPVVGPKKAGDFLPKPVLESYQVLLDAGEYPIENTLLGTFSTYPRYAGPREAVFTALCRKNFGCSHFIIGRDHAGVGTYYSIDANRKIFDDLGDIGIEPVFFDEITYDPSSNSYGSTGDAGQNISGTEARQIILSGKRLPNWFMHDQVQDHLAQMIAEDKPVFYD